MLKRESRGRGLTGKGLATVKLFFAVAENRIGGNSKFVLASGGFGMQVGAVAAWVHGGAGGTVNL